MIQDKLQLDPFKDTFNEMCRSISIEKLEVELGTNNIENAAAYVEKNKVPKIVIEESMLLLLEKVSKGDFYVYSSYVSFFFAHELIHVKYGFESISWTHFSRDGYVIFSFAKSSNS